MSNPRTTTTVKWFNNSKGYGFLDGCEDTAGEDVFVHYRSIITGEGYKTLFEGQQVEYLMVRGDKGWQAAEVVPIGEPGPS
jgi:CspA family cold shock protein